MATLEYRNPERLGEVLDLLREFGEDAKLVAGGQSLMVLLHQGLISPSVCVDLSRVADLAGIAPIGGEIRLGAMTTAATIEHDRTIQSMFPVLAQAAAAVGPLPVRNMGTVGGSAAHNAPGADSPPALLALDARATVAGAAGFRSLTLDDLFTGYFETALRPDEVLTEFRLPALPAGASSGYLKFATRSVDMALVGVAIVVHLEEHTVHEARIAIGGVAPVPFRAREAEAWLEGAPWSEASLREAGRLAARAASPASDIRASADYRRWLVGKLVPRALVAASRGSAARRPSWTGQSRSLRTDGRCRSKRSRWSRFWTSSATGWDCWAPAAVARQVTAAPARCSSMDRPCARASFGREDRRPPAHDHRGARRPRVARPAAVLVRRARGARVRLLRPGDDPARQVVPRPESQSHG